MLSPTTALGPGALPRATAEATPDAVGGGTAFAQALGQAEARQRDAGAPEGACARRTDESDNRSDCRSDGRSTRGTSAGGDRAAAEAASASDEADASRATEGGTEAENNGDTPADAPADAGAAPPTPQDLAAWIAALPLPRPPAAAGAAPHTGTPGADDEGLGRTQRGARGWAAQREPAGAAAPHATLAAPTDSALPAVPAGGREAPSERAVGDVGDVGDAGATGAAANAPASMPPLTALTALTAPATPGSNQAAPNGASAAAPLHAELRAAVGSQEFAPALAGHLSVLVRDGIEHAQLRLNPAELGPIEVRIALDGSRAQVDFSAAHAATRQALQDAVPALAGALRESGLTLAGGGVFEQPREPRGEASPRGSDPSSAADHRTRDDTLSGAAAPRPVRTRGVLDLYA